MSNTLETLLPEWYSSLSLSVCRAHEIPLEATGHVDVVRAAGWINACLCGLMRLPRAGAGIPVHLRVRRQGTKAIWERMFDKQQLVSVQELRHPLLVESFGYARFYFRLQCHAGNIVYQQEKFCLFGVTIPSFLALKVEGVVEGSDGEQWKVITRIHWPEKHFLCSYEGWILRR